MANVKIGYVVEPPSRSYTFESVNVDVAKEETGNLQRFYVAAALVVVLLLVVIQEKRKPA